MGNIAKAAAAHSWDKTHMATSLAENLKRIRLARRINSAELSRRAKVGITYVRDIEKGRSADPSSEKLARVAAALNVTVQHLLSSGDLADDQASIQAAPAEPFDPAEDDDHLAIICEAAGELLREFGAAHSTRESVLLGLRLRDIILAYGPAMPFEQRLELTIAEERPRLHAAWEEHLRRPRAKRAGIRRA
jgi:transcriptional regulator with XRE-family HTH domain